MGVYSISDLAELTGVKTHTLRVWEKRYGLLKPQRTDTNIRYYMDDDLRQLMMVVNLYRKGLRISRIAEMSQQELEQECRKANMGDESTESRIHQALMDMDTIQLDLLLDQAIQRDGFEHTVFYLILPLLDQMEVMWMSGAIEEAHEAFFREMIKRKTIREIDALPHAPDGNRIILMLPQGNQQELSHLFMHYFLRKQGLSVTDMGCEIQLECACSALRRCQTEAILLVNADPVHWQFCQFVRELTSRTQLPIIISGKAADDDWSRYDGQVVALESIDETIRFVSQLRENLGRRSIQQG